LIDTLNLALAYKINSNQNHKNKFCRNPNFAEDYDQSKKHQALLDRKESLGDFSSKRFLVSAAPAPAPAPAAKPAPAPAPAAVVAAAPAKPAPAPAPAPVVVAPAKAAPAPAPAPVVVAPAKPANIPPPPPAKPACIVTETCVTLDTIQCY